jgi:predicted RNA binding protein YcfA (HicA-like mRNA interferase family)
MKKEFKPIIKAAQQRGWTLGPNGKHHVLIHPSGRRMAFSMSPSDRNAHLVLQRMITRIEKEIEDGER